MCVGECVTNVRASFTPKRLNILKKFFSKSSSKMFDLVHRHSGYGLEGLSVAEKDQKRQKKI